MSAPVAWITGATSGFGAATVERFGIEATFDAQHAEIERNAISTRDRIASERHQRAQSNASQRNTGEPAGNR